MDLKKMEENEYKGGARSFNGTVIDDSFQVNINIKWLIQILMLVGMLVYSYYRLETKLNELERNLSEAQSQLSELVDKHIQEDVVKVREMEEQLAWFQKELNLNPLSWRKKKKK
tara:strand:- start:462 stop:803 length:342 start_codon:yes stop_codon:yes gene_type:complete